MRSVSPRRECKDILTSFSETAATLSGVQSPAPASLERSGSAPPVHLDRASPVPLYFQIAQQLEEAIDAGVLSTGQRLEGEVELAQRLAVSRPTVRQAIDRLVEEGLVSRRRGVGTVVVPRRVRRPLALSSLHDDLEAAGRHPTTTVLAARSETADATVAAALDLKVGAPVLFLERLRYADGAPLGILHNFLPPDLLDLTPQLLEQHGLYGLMRAHSIHPQVAEQTIGARVATSSEARLLHGPRDLTVLTMSRTAYDASGRAIEYGTHCYRADRYSFQITLLTR